METKMGLRIKQKRKELGLTMEELGNIVGVQKAAISKWEHGHVERIKRSTIGELADVFNVSPAWLMGYDEEDSGHDKEKELAELLRRFYDNSDGYSTELIEGLLQLTPAQLEMVNDFVQMLAAKNKDRTQAAPSVGEEMK